MFTENDFHKYFDGLEGDYQQSVLILTDILNELSNHAITSVLLTMSLENMEGFRFVQSVKSRFPEEEGKEK